MHLKDIVIVYHADCQDGFGAAYAGWKKFGDSASYIPVKLRDVPPEGLEGKEVYIVDYSYPTTVLLDLEKRTKKLVVLDHHIGAQESVESVKEHIFDNDRSGATITWKYFHPDVDTPLLLKYVEDNDIWRHAMPSWKELTTFVSTVPFDFEIWDSLSKRFENASELAALTSKGVAYVEYLDFIYQELVSKAEMVEFAGHQVLAVNAPRFFRSELGHLLATQKGPFAIVWYAYGDKWHLSLRGDGSIDLTEIAKPYGGSGHKSASAIDLPIDQPLPFKRIPAA